MEALRKTVILKTPFILLKHCFFLLTHYLSVKLKGSGKYSPLFVTRVVTTAECVILRPNRTDGQQTAAAEQSRQNSNHEPRWEVILRT